MKTFKKILALALGTVSVAYVVTTYLKAFEQYMDDITDDALDDEEDEIISQEDDSSSEE